jgi:hypothetical protein
MHLAWNDKNLLILFKGGNAMIVARHESGRSVCSCVFWIILCYWLLCGCSIPIASPDSGISPSSNELSATVALSSQTSIGFQLPDIASFASNPSGQFFLNAAGFEMVSRASPFNGGGTACAHQGAHVHFRGMGTSYTVDLFAPADGIIRLVTPCLNIGATDRYGFSLEFARDGADPLVFNFSIEPQDGTPCGANPDCYKQYIFVEDGQEVKKGQVLGQMYKTPLPSDGAHIHFDVQNERTGQFYCPNIFQSSVVMEFASHFGSDTCRGTAYPATFCYQPAPGEDLTGLVGIP